ncbi:MAG: IS1 family transposase [Chloroflexota bacterium]|nr:IS1 family transposase [Chloroflexota bacterium]MDE2920141.1 IS1 family transposase [Chloroflexota bacterium]
MNRLSRERRADLLHLLNDGLSIRAAGRFTKTKPDTIVKLVVDAGWACLLEHHRRVRNLTCATVQVDEIWSFVGKKAHRMSEAERRWGRGDAYTFTALDPDSRLLVAWMVGPRTRATAAYFLRDLSRCIRGRFQLTTDAAGYYADAAEFAFRDRPWSQRVDYAQIWKHSVPRDHISHVPKTERVPLVIYGDPDPGDIATTYVERHNLTMRMEMRRFHRRTNAHSKKVDNHAHAVATHAFQYNFVRPHGTLTRLMNGKPTTPAMAAGLAERPWSWAEVVQLIEAQEPTARDVAARRKDRRTASLVRTT